MGFEILQEYAEKDGKIIHISEVVRGLACDCICPYCGERMVAKKGNIKAHHFAHHNAENCEGSKESAMHLFCKQTFLKAKTLKLPEIVMDNYNYSEVKEVSIISATAEKRYKDIIPDVTLETSIGTIFVEIIVTHGIDAAKYEKLLKYNVPTIALVANDFDSETKEELEKEILNPYCMSWVIYPNNSEIQERLRLRDLLCLKVNVNRDFLNTFAVPKIYYCSTEKCINQHYEFCNYFVGETKEKNKVICSKLAGIKADEIWNLPIEEIYKKIPKAIERLKKHKKIIEYLKKVSFKCINDSNECIGCKYHYYDKKCTSALNISAQELASKTLKEITQLYSEYVNEREKRKQEIQEEIKLAEKIRQEELKNQYKERYNARKKIITEYEEKDLKLLNDFSLKKCPECGSSLRIRSGKFGKFVGCSSYPNCTFTYNTGYRSKINKLKEQSLYPYY